MTLLKSSIGEWRRMRNISQEKLAEACGVSRATIIAWEQNPSIIKIGNLEKLERALNVDRDDIIFLPSDSKKG